MPVHRSYRLLMARRLGLVFALVAALAFVAGPLATARAAARVGEKNGKGVYAARPPARLRTPARGSRLWPPARTPATAAPP